MEGYNFVDGPCPPRNTLRVNQSGGGCDPFVKDKLWGLMILELRKFPEAFRAIQDWARKMCPPRDGYPQGHLDHDAGPEWLSLDRVLS